MFAYGKYYFFVYDGDVLQSGILFQSPVTPQLDAGAGTMIGTISPTLDTYVVVSVVLNSTNSVSQLNNDTPVTGDGGTANMGGFTLGSTANNTGNSNIQVKEVIVYNTAHDSNNRQRVVNYLAYVGNLSI